MKKYKLIKEYPGSQKIGYESTIGYENYPEFWEEVKEEPNYLITAFRSKLTGLELVINNGGGYSSSNIHISSLIKDKDIEIYSVKNSKGEGFLVSETVKFSRVTLPIIKFEILFDCMYVILSNGNRYELESISKVKTAIFVSADGKEFYDINEDYNLFSVYPKETWMEKRYTLNEAICKETWLHFHTKEARQEYIDNNKPKYSLADIEKAFTAPH